MFKENLKKLRMKNNLSQQQLAEMLHVKPQTISKWELGKSEPDYEMIEMLCNTFNVDANKLLGIKKPKRITNLFISKKELSKVKKYMNANRYWIRFTEISPTKKQLQRMGEWEYYKAEPKQGIFRNSKNKDEIICLLKILLECNDNDFEIYELKLSQIVPYGF